jgi:hypothetical protein
MEDSSQNESVYLLGYFGKITQPSVKLIERESITKDDILNGRNNACMTSETTCVTNQKQRWAQFCMCDCDCACDPGPQ